MYHFALGIALTRRSDCAEARPEFAEALTLRPGFPEAQQQMDACDSAARTDPPPTTQTAAKQ
jgi:hypothetical protein